MTKSDLKTAKMLCKKLANEIIGRWGKNSIYDLTIEGDETDFSVKSTNNETFYDIADFIQVSIACGCSCYITVPENKAGIMTPTLYIH